MVAGEKRSGKRNGRRRPIRLRITALLLVPLISLITLWAFAANLTLGAANDKYDFSTTYEKVGLPGLYLVGQLQRERSLSVVAISARRPEDRRTLGAQRARVDGVQAAFRKSVLSAEVRDASKPETRERLATALKSLDRLAALRGSVDSGSADVIAIIESYGAVLDNVITVFRGLVSVNDLEIFQQGRALISLGEARAYMLRQDALIIAASARKGRMTPEEHTAFVQWAANGQAEWRSGMRDLNADIRGPLQRFEESAEFQRYRAAEAAVIGARDGELPPEAAGWLANTRLLSQAWDQKTTQASLALNEMAKPIGDRIVRRLVLVGGFGLLAVVASVALSLFAGRSLARELRDLQRAALNLAEDRLPTVVARLRRGEEVDVQAEAPPLDIGRSREVARVGDAFTKVQHTAIETAVREAYLREGISRVFLNVAWRSQSLLHRQLAMLDEMERNASDPKALEDLFRLDHLTTRMRRHAEGLVILSGAAAGRGWSRPVHVEDVLRAAVAEVEDYTRVEVVVVTGQAAVIGEAVADVIHLLAELIENATVFSPAPTEVLVRGEMGANGFAVDIIDRGIGLDQAEMDALNLRLSRPPEFDLAVTDRLGLFVVARLAGRHGIRVALQPSLYGGVSAVVLIPRTLIVDVDTPEDEPAEGNGAAPAVRPFRVDGQVRSNGTGAGDGTGSGNGGQSWSTAMLNAPVMDAPPAGATVSFDAPTSFDGPPSFDAPQSFDARQSFDAPPGFDMPPAYGTPPSFGEQPQGPGPQGRAPLPRRVKRASLAPQLRGDEQGAPYPEAAYREPPPDALAAWEDRSAEASRDLFASLQAGWLRGRDEDEGPSDLMGRGPSA